MKIQSILIREGGTITEIDGLQYHFEPLEDGAHVAEVSVEAHIDRFLAIPEGYKAYHGKLTPEGEPTVITLPVINDKQDVRAGGKQTLNGSSAHEASYEINGTVIQLEDVIQKAFASSELSAGAWNDLEEDDRMARIDIALDEIAESVESAENDGKTEGDENETDERAALSAAYEEKFGKKPHYRMGLDKLKAELEAE